MTYEQRCQIEVLRDAGSGQAAIASAVGTGQSAISRELARNAGKREYFCGQAQARAEARRSAASSTPRKMTKDVIAVVKAKLCREQLSPQQLSGWMAATQPFSVSHECIYQHIWADKAACGSLYKQLRRSGKTYNKRSNKLAGRGIIACRIDISERPAIVDLRKRIDDWEADTIIGAGHRGAILSVVERVSKYTVLHKLDDATAAKTTLALIKRLHVHRKRVHTITADNGKEFAGHKTVAKRLGAGFYFATPYHAWERGLNENTNGLVRQYFRKGISLARVTQREVRRMQNWLKARPRKNSPTSHRTRSSSAHSLCLAGLPFMPFRFGSAEEKKQKTFTLLSRFSPAACTKSQKSFCFLYQERTFLPSCK